MRLLRYITLLLSVVFACNTFAQEKTDGVKLKVKIIYEFGADADDTNYKEAIRLTQLYTFGPSHNAREELNFLVSNEDVQLGNGKFIEHFELIEYQQDEKPFLQSDKYAGTDTTSTVLGKVVEYEVTLLPGTESVAIYCPYNALKKAENKGKVFYLSAGRNISFHMEDKVLPEVDAAAFSETLSIDEIPAEKPGVLIMNKTFSFPYRVRPNQRIIAQPVWYDRVDVADADADTVFAYGKAVYIDSNEFALTQQNHMDRNMMNDKLYHYIDTIKYHKYPKVNNNRLDSLWNVVCDRLKTAVRVPDAKDTLLCVFPSGSTNFSRDKWLACMDNKTSRDSLRTLYHAFLVNDPSPVSQYLVAHITDSIRSNIRISPNFDTIYVQAYEELRGHNPSTAHPYPKGVHLYVEDYNTKLTEEVDNRDGGERKSPFKFLDFTFNEFIPDAEEFHLIMKAEEFNDNKEVRLQFVKNSAAFVPNDSTNEVEMEKLKMFFEQYRNDENRNLQRVDVIAQSSPEGNEAGNRALAQKRGAAAWSLVSGLTRALPRVTTDVAPWDSVASLLRKDGKIEIANFVDEAIARFPNNRASQGSTIVASPYYKSGELDPYLAALRRVNFVLHGTTIGQLPDNVIIQRYREGNYGAFGRAEYWVLLNNIKDPDEQYELAKIAYEKTRRPMKYTNHEGYWAFAAANLAAANIHRGIYDLTVLRPFLDLENALIQLTEDSTQVIPGQNDNAMYILKKDDFINSLKAQGDGSYKAALKVYMSSRVDTIVLSSAVYNEVKALLGRNGAEKTYPLLSGNGDELYVEVGRNECTLTRYYKEPDKVIHYSKGQYLLNEAKKFDRSNAKDNIEYLNQIDMVANQLIMTLKNPDSYWAQYLYQLTEIVKKQMQRNKAILTKRGEYAAYERLVAVADCYNGKFMGNDPESVRQRDIVASTSPKNLVIVNIAVDDSQVPGGKELNIAYHAAKELPDTCAESNYLRAIIYNRKYEENTRHYPIDNAYNFLAKAFLQNINMISMASNDFDLLSRYANIDVVDGAIVKWEAERLAEVDSISKTIDDYAFLNYYDAISTVNSNVDAARLSIFKSILLDDTYYDILCVRMKGLQKQMRLKANDVLSKEKYNALKDIKLSFDGIRANLDAGKPAGNALYEQALREVQDLRRDLK